LPFPVATETIDPEFEDAQRNFGALETSTDKFIKDTKVFIESVTSASCSVNQLGFPHLKYRFFCLRCSTLTTTHRVCHVHQDLFTAGASWASHFTTIFCPIAGETDLIGKNPDAALTLKNVDKFLSVQEELRLLIAPELELIESRITAPLKELRDVLKSVRKSITKRDHKVCYVDGLVLRLLTCHFDNACMYQNQTADRLRSLQQFFDEAT
jgi:amphiphysin